MLAVDLLLETCLLLISLFFFHRSIEVSQWPISVHRGLLLSLLWMILRFTEQRVRVTGVQKGMKRLFLT